MRTHAFVTVLIAVLLWGACPVFAQDDPEPNVQWAYASFFGTGWYKIDDQRSAFVVRGTPRWSFGEAEIDENGKRSIGYILRLPLTLGLNQFEIADLPGIIDPDNFATASINVGFDVDIPINRRFSLRPNVEVGYGTVINESEWAWVYRAEARARYRFQPGDIGWTLHGAFGWAGHTPDVGNSDSFRYLSTTVERGHATGWQTKGGDKINLHWQIGYTDFLDSLAFENQATNAISVGNYWQVAASVANAERPIRIWRLKFDRLGLGYNFSPSGEHRAIRLIFRSSYDH